MNIGIYTYWGLPRNSVMYMKSIVELLNKEHKVFIWNVGNNDITDEFKNIDATIHPKDEKGGFQQWLTDNKIEVCIFNTYNIYEQDGDKVDLCDKLKIKTIGYVPYDSLDKNKEHYNLFLSPSLNYKRKALQQRIFNQIKS